MATAQPNSTENHRPSVVQSSKASKDSKSNKSAATKRLQKELMDLMMCGDKNISAFPESDNLFKWIATITGPKDSVYENLKFKLSLSFSARYPYVAPKVMFLSNCFHPNVSPAGDICLDILKEKWTALYDVRTILLSIQALLGEPNLDSPYEPLAAKLWKQSNYKEVMLSKYNTPMDSKCQKD